MRQNLNVPNVLTTLRIVLVPFFAIALLHDHGNDGWWRLWAWVIFAVAMFTDRIDGEIARKHNLITTFGKIADPIADKVTTGMAFIGLSITGDIWWWVTIIVLLREWSVTILRLSILQKVVMPADTL
ncbi:MAG TPA: CDP-alcohol phosphatidyltransferase family protein, partial [Nocardioides sp.]|nr:CDP-alcohol phosphatidyltransferase family protein [Nocardioides sp.]